MGLEFLRGQKLQVPHGFSTRAGGVSAGPYASLNLGSHVGDDPAAVAENRRLLLQASGARELACLDQVHGKALLEVQAGRPDLGSCGTADASLTCTPGVALAIGTADCLPILLHAPDVNAVAAVHAGWKGADLRIAARAVEALVKKGADPAGIQAVLGPCIRSCCYQVSADLAERFTLQFGEQAVDRSKGSPHLDLALASRLALIQAGVPPEGIEDLQSCTCCEVDRYFSHRREHGTTGRMLSFVFLP